jgi:hypothetical protein
MPGISLALVVRIRNLKIEPALVQGRPLAHIALNSKGLKGRRSVGSA